MPASDALMASWDANAQGSEHPTAAAPLPAALQSSVATSPEVTAPSSGAARVCVRGMLADAKPVYRSRTARVADAAPPREVMVAAWRAALRGTLAGARPIYRSRAAGVVVTAPTAPSTDAPPVPEDVVARAAAHAALMASAPVYRVRARHASPPAPSDVPPLATADAASQAASRSTSRRVVAVVRGTARDAGDAPPPLPLAAATAGAATVDVTGLPPLLSPAATAADATGVASSLAAAPASPTALAGDERRLPEPSRQTGVAPARRYACVLLPSAPSRRRRAM